MSTSIKSGSKKYRSEKEKLHKHKSKDKGKAKAALPALSPTAQNESPFLSVTSKIRMSIPPAFASDLRRGAEEMLDSLIMRYSPALDAVLLAYSNVEFEDSTANIVNDCPFAVCDIWFDAVVWAPKVGMTLYGLHSLSSPSHISLILYKTFNVSIPLENIPQDRYSFEEADEVDDAGFEAEGVAQLSGRWKDVRTNKLLGADKEEIGFVVTGLQMSNQMLSLTGSLLAAGVARAASSSSKTVNRSASGPGTQLASELASRPSSSTNPAHLPCPGENLVVTEKAKKAKRKESRVPTMGADLANSAHVDQAVHEAQPSVQSSTMPDIEDEDLRSHRKEQKRAEKEAKKQAKRDKESHRQTAEQARERTDAMLEAVKDEDAPAVASPKRKEKKQKRSADEAALGEKASKRKKI